MQFKRELKKDQTNVDFMCRMQIRFSIKPNMFMSQYSE